MHGMGLEALFKFLLLNNAIERFFVTIPSSMCMIPNLAGVVLVKLSSLARLAAQVQYPVCSCLTLENLTEQSLLPFPKAGNVLTGTGVVLVGTSFAVFSFIRKNNHI